MRKLVKEEMGQIKPLCKHVEDTLIWSCLEGYMGEAWCNDRVTAAQIITADFCFFLGDADSEGAKELVSHIPVQYEKHFIIMVPQNAAWGKLIEEVYGEECHSFTRYAFKKEGNTFNRQKLMQFATSLPEEYTIVPIDEENYEFCQTEEWSEDLCSQFPNAKVYEEKGIGFLVCYKGVPVCGASSYTIYSKGIEIEIDTREDFRRKGLATACAAKLILACLEKDLYPSWDAANLKSVGLAKKLGYHFSHEYIAYDVKC